MMIVYEMRNQSLRELFVGAADVALGRLIERHRRAPPARLSHWDFARHRIFYTEIAAGLPKREAPLFVERYVRAISLPGWRILREGTPGGRAAGGVTPAA